MHKCKQVAVEEITEEVEGDKEVIKSTSPDTSKGEKDGNSKTDSDKK